MQTRTIVSMLAINANSMAATPRVSAASLAEVVIKGFVDRNVILFNQRRCGTKRFDTRTIAIEREVGSA